MGLKYSINKDFFKSWSPTMTYLLGYVYADGSLEDAGYIRGKYLRVSSTDKELVLIVRKAMKSQHKVVQIKPNHVNHKTRYLLRIGDHNIYNDLIALGLTPNKSLTMLFPQIPREYLGQFTRGYFDGDGHVSIETSHGSLKRLRVVFTCGSHQFLVNLANELSKILGLKIDKVYRSQRSYRLAYSTADSVKLFKFMYVSANKKYLKRKYKVFKKFFLQYNKWVDKEVSKIVNHGHVVK
jgi:hypothetical protein